MLKVQSRAELRGIAAEKPKDPLAEVGAAMEKMAVAVAEVAQMTAQAVSAQVRTQIQLEEIAKSSTQKPKAPRMVCDIERDRDGKMTRVIITPKSN